MFKKRVNKKEYRRTLQKVLLMNELIRRMEGEKMTEEEMFGIIKGFGSAVLQFCNGVDVQDMEEIAMDIIREKRSNQKKLDKLEKKLTTKKK